MTTAKGQRGFTLIEVLIVMVVMAILVAIAIPVYLGQRDKARNAQTRGGVHEIRIGIMSYAVDNGDVYPAAVDSQADLVDPQGRPYLSQWPKNAWTGEPMTSDPSARGDYTYTRTASGFTLAGHLSAGDFVVP